MAKRKERAAAFQVIYSIAFSPVKDIRALEKVYQQVHLAKNEAEKDVLCQGLAWELTRGVWEQEEQLNATIAKYSRNWRMERIGLLEQILLRLAIYEMLVLRTPARVVMSESMALADDFGATLAKSFINGILDAVARDSNEQN